MNVLDYLTVMNERIEKWLNRYQNPHTHEEMKGRIESFLKATGKTEDELVSMSGEDAEDLILNYQRIEKAKDTPNNSILSIITAPRALFKFLKKPLVFSRGQIINLEEAHDKHVFSNGDLGKLFDVADVRGKALISLGASLGWAISDVLLLDKNYIKTLIERARESNEKFIFFNRQRKKTGAKALGVINPLAVEWLEKWLPLNKSDSLFDIDEDMINKDLQRLAKEAQLKTTGAVSFHCFRSWTFSSLVKAGFSEFEAKYVVGKKIPLSDATYLHLEESIKEKYQEKYEKYLNIKPSQVGNHNELGLLREENEGLKKRILTIEMELGSKESRLSRIEVQLEPLTPYLEDDTRESLALFDEIVIDSLKRGLIDNDGELELDLSPPLQARLDRLAKKMGISEGELLNRLQALDNRREETRRAVVQALEKEKSKQ